MLSNMNVCRTCLIEDVDKDMSQLTYKIDGETHSYSEIMLFCLSIEVESHPNITSKLCMKCYLKIISFYEFKVLALKNDEYLRSGRPDSETKDEVMSDLSDQDDVMSEEIVYLEDVKVEVKKEDKTDEVSSDEDVLSVIKSTKHEKDNKTEKENDFVKPFKRKYKKKKSTRESKSEKKQKTCCTECGKTVMNLRDHMNTHKPESLRKKYNCKDPSCDKVFANLSARQRHYKSIHLGIKKKCPHCSREVVCIRSHLVTVHNQGPQMYVCDTCNRNFYSKASLEIHSLTHTKERPFKCELCEKDFKSKFALDQHKRVVHDKDRQHLCDYCSKSFFKKYNLQLHIRSHTKEKPLACPECGRCFASPKTLRNHMTIHSDVKKYSCDICDMKFSRPGYLKNHMISHTKEKRYPCKYCGTRFGRSDHRLRHERTAHEQHLPVFDVLNDKS